MRLLDDERGQSVQVGAAILLGFIVIAITIYQTQVVADQNAEVEFNHQQEVRQDMIELRNSISNAGTQGEGDAVTVQLGTQYPPRTIFVNPPPPRGILQTESAGSVWLENAEVDSSYEYSGNGSPGAIVTSNHSTSRLVYTPDYAEFDSPGSIYLEHSLAFARYDSGASNAMTAQNVVNGRSLSLTFLRGNLSEQGSSARAIDPRTISRTTDPITIDRNDTDEPIALHLPTRTPAVWNETLANEPNASVTGYDPSTGTIRVALNRTRYQLQVAAVGVGTGVPVTDRYEVERSGDGNGPGGAYSVDWKDPSPPNANSGADLACDDETCTWDVGASNDNTIILNASTGLPEGFTTDFSTNDTSIGTVDPGNDTTDSAGDTSTVLSARSNGTISVSATSGGGGDLLEISVTNATHNIQPAGPTLSVRLDDLTSQNDNDPRYIASYDVSNANGSFDHVEVTFDPANGISQPLERNTERGGVNFDPDHGSGNPFDVRFDVVYTDSSGSEYVVESRKITDSADAVNPDENDELSSSGSAEFTSWRITDISDGGDPRYGYSYDLTQTGSFSEVIAHALSIPSNGRGGTVPYTARSRNNQNIQLGYAGYQDYRVGYLLRGANGAVVDTVSRVDYANGTGEYSGS